MINNPSILLALQREDLCGLFAKDTTKEIPFLQWFHFIYLFYTAGFNSLLCVFRAVVRPNIYINIYHLNRYQTFFVFNSLIH